MKCDYCEKESVYSCGVVLDTGIIDIFCCDDHLENAKAKQENILSNEEFKQRTNWITRQIENSNKLI